MKRDAFEGPSNNALKLTSLASRGGLGSQLNAVFAGPLRSGTIGS